MKKRDRCESETGNPSRKAPVVVVLSGAGLSVESGLPSYRGAGGLWENKSFEELATPEAWLADSRQVLRFYNERRDQLRKVSPNAAHRALVDLESRYDVRIITQNVDDLHERAGSSCVLHLHGELMKGRSEKNPECQVDLGVRNIEPGDRAPDGERLRPAVVWFGEIVPHIDTAEEWVKDADIFLVVGTSLQVYPAAGLLQAVPSEARCFEINTELCGLPSRPGMMGMEGPAGLRVPEWVADLLHS